ncbi:hypothetical protein Csa_018362 [Cucumis sativus]|uniref:Uncharacterized protein n=1 Tax=Cucumis sativus TaxID=3659 RepID=A0A0A0KJE6_CUCSA|nr:hypothetical protein Csa_018362 [Cucumis sativus]
MFAAVAGVGGPKFASGVVRNDTQWPADNGHQDWCSEQYEGDDQDDLKPTVKIICYRGRHDRRSIIISHHG